VDVSSRESVHALAQTATAIGDVTGVIHAAGVSPSQAKPGSSSPSTCTGQHWSRRWRHSVLLLRGTRASMISRR
jgi:hypothetical protein